MDKRKTKNGNTEASGSPRKFSTFNLEDGPKSITIWKDGNFWLIYDQTNDAMTQGTSYEDAIYMLSDLLKCRKEEI